MRIWDQTHYRTATAEETERELKGALARLRNAFVQHRTLTHKVAPNHCETCHDSDEAIRQANEYLSA